MFSKRTKALLLAGALFSGALVSCGNDEESSSEKASAATKGTESASVSETETTADKTTEASTEKTTEVSTEATTEEKTTAETTSEAASEEETSLTTEAQAAEDNSIVGKWKQPYALSETIYEFGADGVLTETVDFTPYYGYSDTKGWYLGQDADISFDGSTICFTVDGKKVAVFEKESSEGGMDGTYRLAEDPAGQSYSGDPLETYVFKDGCVTKYTVGEYTVDGENLTEVFPTESDDLIRKYRFAVKGDELALYDEYGEETLVRAE